MLENRNEVYYLNDTPFTGLAWTAREGFFAGDFTTSEETCRNYAGDAGIIPYSFENGVMV